MIFVAKDFPYDLPIRLADHMARNWESETPFEPNIAVIEEIGQGYATYHVLEGGGGWFKGNLPRVTRAK